MEIDKILIGIVLFSVVILSGVLIFSDIETSYSELGVDMDTDYYTDLETAANENFDETNKTAQSMYDNTFTKSSDTTTTSERLWGSSFSTLQLVTNIPTIIYRTLNSLSTKLGVPKFMIDAALIIITISFIFTIIYILFGKFNS